MYFAYTCCLFAGLLLSAPWRLLRYRTASFSLKSRFGFIEIPALKNSIWVHAVSVGEVKAVQKLLARLRVEYPGNPLVLTTITATGQKLAQETPGLADHVFYFPFDFQGAVKRTLDRADPELVVIAETEIWPNFLRECRRRDIPVALLNGRISDRSFPRYRWIRRWLGTIFKDYALLGMQSELDRQRIESLGAPPKIVRVLGNLKFDSTATAMQLDSNLAQLLREKQPLWIAASTTSSGAAGIPDEEEFVLKAFVALREKYPALKLLLAPRHPERFDPVEKIVRSHGLDCVRRSSRASAIFKDVFLLDTIGELAACFPFARVVYIGGSLVPRGGHNILEPAAAAKPIVFGPHMENFREISTLFLKANAAIQVYRAEELASAIDRLLQSEAAASELGTRALDIIRNNSGATDRAVAALNALKAGALS